MGGARQAGGLLCRVACLATHPDARKARVVAHRKRASRTVTLIAPVVFLLFLLGMWWVIVTFSGIESWRLPSPAQTWQRALTLAVGSSFWNKTLVTSGEAIAGSVLGALVALPLAYLIYRSPLVSAAVEPFLGATQALPAIALAPLLVFGSATVFGRSLHSVRFSFSSRFSSLQWWVYGISILTFSRPPSWMEHRA